MFFKLLHKDHENCGHHHHDSQREGEGEEQKIRVIPEKKELEFKDFLAQFSEIELPISIHSETIREIEAEQEPLNAAWIYHFILDQKNADDFTEFSACFHIKEIKEFHAIIYWEASLEGNAYFLATFDKKGKLIDHKLIAGTVYLEDGVKQLVCTIAKDWSIHRGEGQLGSLGQIVHTEPKITFMQISKEGEIVED